MINCSNILFDLDGTLTDSMEGVINSIAYALKYFGVPVNDKSELKKCVGPPLTYSFGTFFKLSEKDAIKAVEIYREYYAEKGIYEARLFDGIDEMLNKLKKKGKTLIMATSKTEIYAKQIASHFDIEKYFTFIGGASYDTTRIEKKDVIEYILKVCNITDISSCVMLGDRLYDIIGASSCNIQSIGALYGYGSKQELEKAGCKIFIEKPVDLCNII